jgi:hypothetical protein
VNLLRAIVPAVAVVSFAIVLQRVGAAPGKLAPPAPDAAGPPTTLASVGRVARVRVDVSPGGAAVQHDVVFAKDALTVVGNGQPTLFVAFTAQQRPLAIEATRYALAANGAFVEATATKVEVIDVFSRPKTAALLLGPTTQAGHVIRLPRDGAPFGLRLRSAIATHELASPSRSIVLMARLGVRGASPMPVDAIEVAAILGGTLRGARALFCGPAADPRPLTLSFPDYPLPPADAGTISPTTAKRSNDDDLCLDVLL